jgi:hypothetical protein
MNVVFAVEDPAVWSDLWRTVQSDVVSNQLQLGLALLIGTSKPMCRSTVASEELS